MPRFESSEFRKRNSFKTILIATLIAGTLDALAAVINYTINGGKFPSKIFQYIASGVVGQQAFTGGISMTILGIIFHYSIAFAFTLFFFLIYPRLKILSKNKILTAVAYGIFVWLVMNLIVIPTSNINAFPSDIKQGLVGAVILIVAIGLPLSFIISKYYQADSIST